MVKMCNAKDGKLAQRIPRVLGPELNRCVAASAVDTLLRHPLPEHIKSKVYSGVLLYCQIR